MFLALFISGVLAYVSAKSGWYLEIAFNSEGGMAPMCWIILFAPLACVIISTISNHQDAI